MTSRILLLMLAVGGMSAAVRAQEEETAIRAILDSQVRGWNSGSIDRYMEGYWRSDSLAFVAGGTVTYGYDSTRARYQRSYRTREAMGRLEFADLRVEVTGPSHAVVKGVWKLHRAADMPWGRFTLLVRRLPEGWRVVYDHTSSAP